MDTGASKQALSKINGPSDSKLVESLDEIFDRHNVSSLGSRQDNRADHTNCRYLLWKALASFPEVAEQKSRDVVPLFLRFVRYEDKFPFLHAFKIHNAAFVRHYFYAICTIFVLIKRKKEGFYTL